MPSCPYYIPPPPKEMWDFVGGGSSAVIWFFPPDRVLKFAHHTNPDYITTDDVVTERKILGALGSHPRIIQYFGKWKEEDGTAILEYHPRGCLRQVLLFGEEKDQIPQHKWAIQIVEAVVFVHSKGYVHGDLNASNFLVTSDDNLVLCDFACSGKIGTKPTILCGSAHCFRPRVRDAEDEWVRYVDDDLFALASVFYELYTRERAYADKEPHFEIGKLFGDGVFPDVAHISVGKVIMKCWKGEYKTAEQVLADLHSLAPC